MQSSGASLARLPYLSIHYRISSSGTFRIMLLYRFEVITASRRRGRVKFKPRIERRVRTQGRTHREGAGYGDRYPIYAPRRGGNNPAKNNSIASVRYGNIKQNAGLILRIWRTSPSPERIVIFGHHPTPSREMSAPGPNFPLDMGLKFCTPPPAARGEWPGGECGDGGRA